MKQAIIEAILNRCEFCALGGLSGFLRRLQIEFGHTDEEQFNAVVKRYI